jgi:hypothetical protein
MVAEYCVDVTSNDFDCAASQTIRTGMNEIDTFKDILRKYNKAIMLITLGLDHQNDDRTVFLSVTYLTSSNKVLESRHCGA